MTKTDAYFYRLAMPCPFATDSGAALTPIANTTGNDVNFHEGFPSVYSAPASNGGKFVTRGEMNAIGNLASQNQFYFLAGGINTFDEDFCTQIGGYPEGAVLEINEGNIIIKVISLKDNNKVNFNGNTSPVGKANGIVDGFVDGQNWNYANGNIVARKKTVVTDISNLVISPSLYHIKGNNDSRGRFLSGGFFLIGTYAAQSSGLLSIENVSLSYGDIYNHSVGFGDVSNIGCFNGQLCSLVRRFSQGDTIVYPEVSYDPTSGYTFNANGYVNIGFGSSSPSFVTASTMYQPSDHPSAGCSNPIEDPIQSGTVFVNSGDTIVLYGVKGAASYSYVGSTTLNQNIFQCNVSSITASFSVVVI